jgi:F0F1-type ATP synthase assembly protein I
MDWKQFFKLILKIAIGVPLGGGALLGLIGFLVSGKQGGITGAIWGVIFGLVIVFYSGILIFARQLNIISAKNDEATLEQQSEDMNE